MACLPELRAFKQCGGSGTACSTRSHRLTYRSFQQHQGADHQSQRQQQHGRATGRRLAATGNGTTAQGTQLRMFLQSASVKQWERWTPTGLFYGFSTNPVTLERDGVKCNIKSLSNLAAAAFELGAQELHLESWGDNAAKLRSVAFDLAGIDPQRVVVKLPCTLEGIQTATLMRDASVRVTLTGLYSPSQVLVAQAVGAEYASTYLGRMSDLYGEEQGKHNVLQMQQIVTAQRSAMRLVVASLRSPADLALLASQGCTTFNLPPNVATKLFQVQGTLDTAGEFDAAARRNGGTEQE